MRYLFLSVMALGFGLSVAPKAQADVVLVELFTSQGCSSCPPADAFLGDLAESPEVVALAYHVDYWDYLGWKDTFAQAAFSQRQRTYAPRVDRQYIDSNFRGSFTPEMVVQGTDSLIGSAAKIVRARVAAHATRPAMAKISMVRDAGRLQVSLAHVNGAKKDVRVMLARYTATARVDVKRGENAGRQLTYHNVVTELVELGRWDSATPVSYTAADDGGSVAVFLQRGASGPVVAAAHLK